jgi:c(7)-type cytochrome triheme protein
MARHEVFLYAGMFFCKLRHRLFVVSLCITMLLGVGGGAATTIERGIQLAVLMPATVNPTTIAPPPARSPAPVDEVHPARRALDEHPIHDESSPGYLRLQRIDEATSHMPRDALGFPDWMNALRSGDITPRAGIAPGSVMNVLDLDVVMKNTKAMPYVRFPHRSHTLWLDCSNCHPAPFTPQSGANPVNMTEIFKGRYCGMCHDRVAFITFFSCSRCHSVAQDAAAPSK